LLLQYAELKLSGNRIIKVQTAIFLIGKMRTVQTAFGACQIGVAVLATAVLTVISAAALRYLFIHFHGTTHLFSLRICGFPERTPLSAKIDWLQKLVCALQGENMRKE
jgi:hypothetical protein